MLITAVPIGSAEDGVGITIIGNHNVLIATMVLDGEDATVIGVEFSHRIIPEVELI